jgi:transcriptional regulator with XRE-family HTH domain
MREENEGHMRERIKSRAGLADFLQNRRARLHPEQFHFPAFQRRRTRGLRREELAGLVGVGVSWYTWLEQGAGPFLDDQVDQKYVPNATTQAILDGFMYPARLFDPRLNVVGWNESANRVFGDYPSRTALERNAPWFHFMHPSSRKFEVHWEREAWRCLASLHARYDQYPDDRWLTELIAELQQASPEFRAWWPEHEIVLDCGSIYEINHPLVGRLALHPTVFPMPEQPDLQMIVYTPLAQDDTTAKLRALMTKEGQYEKMTS